MTKIRRLFQGTLLLGAVLVVAGGVALGFLRLARPSAGILPGLEAGYRDLLLGLLSGMLLGVSVFVIEALERRSPAREEPAPRPVLTGLRSAPHPAAEPRAPGPAALKSLFQAMKTYVDLEMWELALEKATAIVQGFSGTREAEVVSRLLNDIRWKAEPKFVSQQTPLTADQEKDLREKGLAEMHRHVLTYMDLDMWELARQKALAIIRNFPESPQAIDLMKIYDMIEKKAQTAPPSAPGEPPPPAEDAPA